MVIQYETEGFRQYRILRTENENVDPFVRNMLMACRSEHLIKTVIERKDSDVEIRYEISGMIQLSKRMTKTEFNAACLKQVYQSVFCAIREVEDMMLPLEGLSLHPEDIYYMPGGDRYRFCYDPETKEDIRKSLQGLTEYCLKYTDHRDKEGVSFIYAFYRDIRDEAIGFSELKSRLDSFMVQEKEGQEKEMSYLEWQHLTQNEEKRNLSPSPVIRIDHESEKSGDSDVRAKSGWPYILGLGLSALIGLIFLIRYFFIFRYSTDLMLCIFALVGVLIFGYAFFKFKREEETEKCFSERSADSAESGMKQSPEMGAKVFVPPQLSESIRAETDDAGFVQETESDLNLSVTTITVERPDETILLSSNPEEKDAWILESVGEELSRISLDILPGVIGRKKDVVDYPVSAAEVSRRHVLLYQSDANLFVEDLHSKNGTYVNQELVAPESPHVLKEGDVLTIGKQKYRLCRL